jgi:hypothetical protein
MQAHFAIASDGALAIVAALPQTVPMLRTILTARLQRRC